MTPQGTASLCPSPSESQGTEPILWIPSQSSTNSNSKPAAGSLSRLSPAISKPCHHSSWAPSLKGFPFIQWLSEGHPRKAPQTFQHSVQVKTQWLSPGEASISPPVGTHPSVLPKALTSHLQAPHCPQSRTLLDVPAATSLLSPRRVFHPSSPHFPTAHEFYKLNSL